MRSVLVGLLGGGVVVGSWVARDAAPLVAVLEHTQCEKDSTQIAVRPLFQKSGPRWESIPAATWGSLGIAQRTWTVAFDGKDLGTVRASAPSAEKEGILAIDPGQKVPRVGNPKLRFIGWCKAPRERPLMLVSPARVSDPDGWKRITPDGSIRDRLFPQFKKDAGGATACDTDGGGHGFDWHYTARDLRVRSAYGDKRGRQLIALRLGAPTHECDGLPDDSRGTFWYIVDGPARLLPFGSRGVTEAAEADLIDAGDYDGDGRSEIIFWYSGYNDDGYSLYASDLSYRVDVRWGYH